MSSRNLAVAIGVIGLMLAGMVTGTAAYQSFTADRQASLNVVQDNNGIIGLAPGSSTYVSYESDGSIQIDVTGNGASGVNADAALQIGSKSSPSSTFAFSMTNNFGNSRTVDLSYTLDGSDASGGTNETTFRVYDSGGASITNVSEGDSSSFSMSSAATYYVVLEIDFTGISDTEDYSGTLSVKAN